jgi:hypothetical protein
MLKRFALLTAAVALVAAPAAAAPAKVPVELKSVSALAFGPDGLLFIGDPQAAMILAVQTGDTAAGGKGDVKVEKLGDLIGATLGTAADQIAVNDVKVNPASGNVFIAVTRGKGKDAMPVILKMTRDGKLAEFPLKDLSTTAVHIPNATDKQRAEAITSLAFVDGKVYVAGLSNEEFASTLRAIPYPFSTADKGADIQIFHGAHGRLETNAPVRTFAPYKIGPADYLVAAYTCTPLVKIPVSDLKDGAKVKGTTIAELGNMNRPLDMVVYNKGGKDYVLMANSRHGVIKLPTEGFGDAEPITTPVRGGGKTGIGYETITDLTGVVQLDKLDNERALVLIQGQDKSLTLKSVPLP